jgi:hypothetical protein
MKQIITKDDLDGKLVIVGDSNKVTVDLPTLRAELPEIGKNIYTEDGTLTANRTITQNGHLMKFLGGTWNEVNVHGNNNFGGYVSVSGSGGKGGMYQNGKYLSFWSTARGDIMSYDPARRTLLLGNMGGAYKNNLWITRGLRDTSGSFGTANQVLTTQGDGGDENSKIQWRDTVNVLFKEDGGTVASTSGTTIEVSEDISAFNTLLLNLEWGGDGNHCKTIVVDVDMLLAGKRIMFSNTTFTHAAANYVKLGADNTHLVIAMDDDVDDNNLIISVKGVI